VSTYDQLKILAVPLGLTIGSALLMVAFAWSQPAESTRDPWTHIPEAKVHTDHSTFFEGELKDGPAVTAACLSCHPETASQVMHTQHWNWVGDPVVIPGHEDEPPLAIGKKNVINNFCIGIESNWPSCTKCHAGYGWKDNTFDFTDATHIDCLVCHDQSHGYVKGASGVPPEDVDLMAAAQSVGRATRANCGSCHFNGGGGNAVKHGDLDGTMINPNERIDVHMGRYNLQCVDCHQTKEHNIPGRAISVSVDDHNRVKCSECHTEAPHNDDRLNAHTATVACQTCHIPSMGTDTGTKMTWDWSTAGDKELEARIGDPHTYMAIKGTFQWEHGVKPEYAWYNGKADRYLLGETIDPTKPTVLAGPLGDITDPTAKIWPFKVHRGRQPYDAGYSRFIVPKTVGPGGFWTEFDWELAARLGAEETGQPYSGQLGFAPTEMYWPLSHMVQTKERTLQCQDCHGENGRMDWDALGYSGDPATHGGRAQQGVLQ